MGAPPRTGIPADAHAQRRARRDDRWFGFHAGSAGPYLSCIDRTCLPRLWRLVVSLADRLMRFMSDNTASASAEIVNAIIDVNRGLELAYGEDRWSLRLDQVFGEFFATDVRVFTVATGTAANSLALATLTPPYGAI